MLNCLAMADKHSNITNRLINTIRNRLLGGRVRETQQLMSFRLLSIRKKPFQKRRTSTSQISLTCHEIRTIPTKKRKVMKIQSTCPKTPECKIIRLISDLSMCQGLASSTCQWASMLLNKIIHQRKHPPI